MSKITFEELSNKEVISCNDCRRLGFITDLVINSETACITAIIVTNHCGISSLFKKKCYTIPWDCIKSIGDDLIIVEYIIIPEIPQENTSLLKSIFRK